MAKVRAPKSAWRFTRTIAVISTMAVTGIFAELYAGDAHAQTTVYRLASKTQTDTTTISVPYATTGRTRSWAYTWNAAGQLLTVDGPLAGSGDTLTYTYNANGSLASVTNQIGQVTTISAWNGRGQPMTLSDPNGVIKTLTYDIHDRLLTATTNPGASQSQYAFEYDAVGNLTKITLPEGGWLGYTYDAGNRLTQVANNRGETQTFAVNALGDPTSVTVKTSGAIITAQQTSAYDELGRIIQAVGAGAQTTGFGYDKVDNLKSVTDARGKLFQTAFDPLDRVIAQTNPQSQTVQLDYSPSDQLKSHKDGRTLETTRTIDGFGQVIREVSPDRGTLTYWYDAAGNLTTLVDGDGQETNYAYDNANRLLTTTFVGASAETITYSYDSTASGNKGAGRLTGVTEESGSSAFKYDGQGRLVQDAKVIQGKSYVVEYAYDKNGRVTGLTLPSGRTVTVTRASDGLATDISTKATALSSSETLASGVAYRPFGPLEGLTYGNGLALTKTYDQNYWLTRTEVKATGATRLDLSFARNENGQLTAVTDNASSGRGATFSYTDAGRLTTATGSWGDHTYTYDAAGNRVGKSAQAGATAVQENLVLSTTSNRVDRTQQGGGTTIRTLTWRPGGDLSQAVTVSGPTTYDYQYNARKRLRLVKLDGWDRAQYGYDFRGLRVWRTVLTPTPTRQSHYVFDPDGHLLAEHDGTTGAVVREYVWLDDMVVAVIESSTGTPATYFIHTGQLDEPLVMTDAAKTDVWDAFVEPFGQAQVFNSTPVDLGLRLPGQWEEAETGGLFQNWRRNYDPSLGRYIESDPIGLGGGQNVYAYVDGDPLQLVDAEGLEAACAYYADMCKQSENLSRYYCDTSQLMCNSPYFSPFLWGIQSSKIAHIRQCLIEADKKLRSNVKSLSKFCDPKGRVCYRSPTDRQIDEYHRTCYRQCGVSPSRYPSLRPFGLPLGNGAAYNPAPRR
jgi:RHS repeat-associated protein